MMPSRNDMGGFPWVRVRPARSASFRLHWRFGVGAARAQAQTFELKLSHFVPPNHAYHKWATAWAEQLGKDSGGRLKIPRFIPTANWWAAEPAVRRRAQRHDRHRVHAARRDARPLCDDRACQPAVLVAEGRLGQRHHVAPHERARPDLPRERAPGPARALHGGGQSGGVQLQIGDPYARPFQGREDPLRGGRRTST